MAGNKASARTAWSQEGNTSSSAAGEGIHVVSGSLIAGAAPALAS